MRALVVTRSGVGRRVVEEQGDETEQSRGCVRESVCFCEVQKKKKPKTVA